MTDPADEPIARLLRDGEVEVVGRMPWSSNGTYICEVLCGDEQTRSIYKPRRGERPLWDFPSGTLANRERAAYLVSEALGWDVVPLTVLRDGRVAGTAFNPVDLSIRTGLLQQVLPVTFPHVPNYDVAGVVTDVTSSIAF